MAARKVLFIFGTRPEAIKLCPLIRRMSADAGCFQTAVCVTGQHREMLDQVLSVFSVKPDYDLALMRPGQTLTGVTSRILAALGPVIADCAPDMVLVQGDTTSTMCGALTAFYQGVPVGHVEAGLRTGDLRQPFPEELNRSITGRIADLHFAATRWAARNLERERVPPERIHVTGNTGIDAVLHVAGELSAGRLANPEHVFLNPDARLVLVTAHRRESFGGGIEHICDAIACLARRKDLQIVYPVHPNPNVKGPVEARLGELDNVSLIDPLDYVSFVSLMCRSYLILTDSGGIQEEAPSLGKPVLVMRAKTERPEAVEAGSARLVGTEPERIVSAVVELLDNSDSYERMARVHNPYGDGRASERIAALTASYLAG